jgi:hypothetical protein
MICLRINSCRKNGKNNRYFMLLKVLNMIIRIQLTNSLTHGAEPYLRSRKLCSYSELPNILWNPKVHYRVHKSPLMISNLSQVNVINTSHHISLRSMLIQTHKCSLQMRYASDIKMEIFTLFVFAIYSHIISITDFNPITVKEDVSWRYVEEI